MEPRHAVVATGGLTPLIAQALVYLSSWPLAALDAATAMAFAGLLVAAGGAAVMAYRTLRAPARPQVVPIGGIRQ